MLRIASHFISSSQELLGYKLFDSFKKLLAGHQMQGPRKQKVLTKQKPLGGLGEGPEMPPAVRFDIRQQNGSGG